MTRAEAREAGTLLAVQDSAQEWRESFEDVECADKDHDTAVFGTICCRDKDGSGKGWTGELTMPRTLAIEMMRWLENYADRRLSELGVVGEKS